MDTLPHYITEKVDNVHYVNLKDPESWRAINLNHIKPTKITAFPHNIYKGETISIGTYVSSVRDLDTQYTFGTPEEKAQFPCFVERDSHPDHFSRYIRPVNVSMWMTGNMPGYNRAMFDIPPANMAPPKYCNENCKRM